jgi:hypothetical protein
MTRDEQARKTRDPERIDAILDRLRVVWKRHPDLRLGQMVDTGAKFWRDQRAFVPEDEALMDAIERTYL